MVKKFFKKYFNKFKKYEREKIYFSLDTSDKSARTKIRRFISSKEIAGSVRGVAKTGLTLYKTTSNIGSLTVRNFRYRSIIFWITFIIAIITITVFFIRSTITIIQNPTSFIQGNNKKQSNYITFNYSSDGILNKYYKNNPDDYHLDNSKLSSSAVTLIKSEVGNVLSGANLIVSLGHKFAVTDYTFTADPPNYAVNVGGSYDAVKSLLDIENKYYNPDSSKNIVTMTDQYGRSLFYGESYAMSKGHERMVLDPSSMMNPNFTLNTKSIPQQNGAFNGKSLWQISGDGKYWGRELKGTVFDSATITPATNTSFEHVTFSISNDGFFTAFTQYLNIILSDYKYHHQVIGKVYSTDYNAQKGKHYKPNVTPKTDDDINNVYIQSLQQYQPILIWINQDSIFTVKHDSYQSSNLISYTFKWADSERGNGFKQATANFLKPLKTQHNLSDPPKYRKAGDMDKGTDLDPTGNYWYYGTGGNLDLNTKKTEIGGGFTKDSDTVPNFLDLGFDHLSSFPLDASGYANAKKDDHSKDAVKDKPDKFLVNQWMQPVLLPYKNGTGKEPDADFLNTNYNQPHIFHDETDDSWFSIAYGTTDSTNNGLFSLREPIKHDKIKSDFLKKEPSYPYLLTASFDKTQKQNFNFPYPSFFGFVSNSGTSAFPHTKDEQLNISKQINQAAGLVGVVTVSASASDENGIKKLTFDNAVASKISDDNTHKYYSTANWGVFIPASENMDYKPKVPKGKVSPAQTQKHLPIASSFGIAADRALTLTVVFSNGIGYSNLQMSAKAINIAMFIVAGIFLLGFLAYILWRYRLLSVIIFMLCAMFIMLIIIFMTNAHTNFTYENISIISFGLMLLLVSIDMSIKIFRRRTISFFRNASDKLVISKTLILLFLNYFALIFIEAILLSTQFGSSTLVPSLILLAAMMVVILLLVPIFLVFFLQTSIFNKNYEDDVDPMLLKTLITNKYTLLEKLIHQKGLSAHINDRKELLDYFTTSHSRVLLTTPQNSNKVKAIIAPKTGLLQLTTDLNNEASKITAVSTLTALLNVIVTKQHDHDQDVAKNKDEMPEVKAA